tara:strand:+ start:2249 stop:3895 length:1647 start_codon:yes stop_codon:yes gene_type:complete
MRLKNTLEQQLSSIIALTKKYDFEDEILNFQQLHQNFKLRLPLVGAFSAGKSSLINAYLGEKLLSVEVTAETCLPTEIFYSDTESISLMGEQGQITTLNRAQLKDQNYLMGLNSSQQKTWLEVGLPHPALAQYPDLVLVDMPGWDSGIAAHSQAVDHYIHSSGAFCLTISANEGTLRESIQQALTELKLFDKPVIVFVTKIDKIQADEVDSVVANIRKMVKQQLAIEPLAVLPISARKKQLAGVNEAITQVLSQSDNIYQNMVLSQLLITFERLTNKLTILTNQESLTLAEAQLACEAIPEQLAELKQQINEFYQQIDGIVPSCVQSVKTNFGNNLKRHSESLSSSVLNGGNVQNQVASALRTAYLTTIEQDFKPKITRQLKSLQQASDIAPSEFSINNNFSSDGSNIGSQAMKMMIPMLIIKLISFVPVLAPFAAVINVIAGIFVSSADKQMQRESQREEARQYVLNTLIPQVVNQVDGDIHAALSNMVQQIKQEIDQEAEQNAADKQQALQQLQSELVAEQQLDAEHKQELNQDLQQVEQWQQMFQ